MNNVIATDQQTCDKLLQEQALVAVYRKNHRHSGRIRSTENNTQCFSRKNANTNNEPEIIVHVISHLKVSQIQKIKSK